MRFYLRVFARPAGGHAGVVAGELGLFPAGSAERAGARLLRARRPAVLLRHRGTHHLPGTTHRHRLRAAPHHG